MDCIPLADYSILNKEVFGDVYEPFEDTFVLIDALEKDIEIIKNISPTICLEIGSGSGVVTTSLGKVLGPIYYLCTDINSIAASATKATSKYNDVQVDVVISDLAFVFEDRLINSIDLLIFNPPYAVTPSEEVGKDNIFCATSGGIQGREVMDRFFPVVPKLLSKRGLFYLICIKENDIGNIKEIMSKYGLVMETVIDRRCGREHLFALRFSYKNIL